MVDGPKDPLGRARSLYRTQVNPLQSREMRELALKVAAEGSARFANTILCDYLNRWNEAGPAEVAAAEAAIARALADDPDLYLAHYAQGFLYRARGQHRESLEAFARTIKSCPDFARAYAQRGEQLLYLGEFKDAIDSVERALQISPKSAVRGYFYWVIGRSWFFLGDYHQAVSFLTRSVMNWGNVWYNRAYLISAHALSGKQSDAKRHLVRFNGRFPDYTISRVIENESATPDDNPLIVEGRERFHDGLRRAGFLD